MAKYQITAPDGNSYEITAPDTASENEVMEYAKSNYQKPSAAGLQMQPAQKVGVYPKPEEIKPTMARTGFDVLRGTLEMGGSVAGGFAGAGAGIPTGPGAIATGMAGGGLGYAAGKKIADIIEELAGYKNSEDIPEQLKQSVRDVGVGALMEVTGYGIGAGVSKAIGLPRAVIDAAKRHLPSLTEAGAMKKVGRELAETVPSAHGAANIERAREISEQIPGFKPTLGMESGQASVVQRERALIKSVSEGPEKGADILQERIVANNEAIRNAYESAMKGGSTDDLIKLVQEKDALMKTQAARLGAGPSQEVVGGRIAKELEPKAAALEREAGRLGAAPIPQAGGKAVREAVESAYLESKPIHEKLYQDIPPDAPMSSAPIAKATRSMEKQITSVNKENYPTSAIADIKTLLRGKKPGAEEKAITILDAYGRPIPQEAREVTKKEVVFHDWLDMTKRLGREIEDARRSNNRELAMRLTELKKGVDDALDTVGTGQGPIPDIYSKAKGAFIDFANRFYKDTVADIRKRGKQITGLAVPDSEIGGRFATPEGIDTLTRAVGKDKATLLMRDHFNRDLIDSIKGDINPSKIANWINNPSRIHVLNKLGLTDEYVKLGKKAISNEADLIAEVNGMAQTAIGGRFATPEGANELIRAIGKDKAVVTMRDYFNRDLADKTKGDLSPINVMKWVQKNVETLKKYGLMDEYKGLAVANKDYAIVNKVLGADREKVISNVLGQGRDIKMNAIRLMGMAKGNKEAEQGIQRAVGDHILKTIYNTAKDLAGGRVISNAKFVRVLDGYKPALEVIYKNNPEKLKMLEAIQEAVEIMNRTAKSPTGGGSDTFELTASKFGGLMKRVAGRFGGATVGAGVGSIAGGPIGAAVGATAGMAGWEAFSKHSAENINRFMLRATFDPAYAQTLIAMAKGVKGKAMDSMVAAQMAKLGVVGIGGGNIEKIVSTFSNIPETPKSSPETSDPLGIR